MRDTNTNVNASINTFHSRREKLEEILRDVTKCCSYECNFCVSDSMSGDRNTMRVLGLARKIPNRSDLADKRDVQINRCSLHVATHLLETAELPSSRNFSPIYPRLARAGTHRYRNRTRRYPWPMPAISRSKIRWLSRPARISVLLRYHLNLRNDNPNSMKESLCFFFFSQRSNSPETLGNSRRGKFR